MRRVKTLLRAGRDAAVRDVIRLGRIFLRTPESEDVRSISRAAPWGALVTAINATVLFFDRLGAGSSGIFGLWCLSTVAMSLVMLRRSLRVRNLMLERVSRRAVLRLNLFVLFMALPWVSLAAVMGGIGTPWERSLGLLLLIGMAAGGVLMLHRVMLAALIYCASILVAAATFILVIEGPAAWPVAIYAVLFGTMMFVSAHVAGEMSRERDRSMEALSEANREIRRLAQEDDVTGLLNRSALQERLAAMTGPGAPPFSLFMLDLDRFKNVNDSFGHHVGDGLLRVVGWRLRHTVRAVDVVARFGGDEFVVLVPGAAETAEAQARAGRILQSVNTPAEVHGQVLYPGTSIGGASFPQHGRSAEEILLAADLALHAAKEGGRGTFVNFSGDLAENLAAADRIEADLRQALAEGGLELCYQPKVALADGRVVGAEALLRWTHAERGPVPPSQFLGVAAERGLVGQVTDFVFARAARDILAWRAEGFRPGPVSLNIHAMDLKAPPALLARLEALRAAGIAKSDLVLEITEGCFFGRGSDETTVLIDTLNELGFEISLDDFGTGHAALSHLKQLPVDEIKIDARFVAGLGVSHADHAIVSAIAALAGGMRLRVVAEGVETEAQRRALAELGVGIGQGFLWAPALSAAAFRAYATDTGARRADGAA